VKATSGRITKKLVPLEKATGLSLEAAAFLSPIDAPSAAIVPGSVPKLGLRRGRRNVQGTQCDSESQGIEEKSETR
jgi:hypothetical protein